MGSTLTVGDGTTIHYTDTAEGARHPIVLVHGITESSATWEPIEDLLVYRGHRVITLDLRGHGQSGTADSYDLMSLVGDVAAVISHTCADTRAVRLVGHSLGGTVVSALASAMAVRSTVNVDQSLRLGEFQSQLQQVAPMLRDPASFGPTIMALFDELAGDVLPDAERERIEAWRQPRQEVVLGVWEPVIESTPEALDLLVRSTAGSISSPYLSLHGVDPGPDYADWLTDLVATATVEVWPDYGHYPHLVEPERFVDRLEAFWGSE